MWCLSWSALIESCHRFHVASKLGWDKIGTCYSEPFTCGFLFIYFIDSFRSGVACVSPPINFTPLTALTASCCLHVDRLWEEVAVHLPYHSLFLTRWTILKERRSWGSVLCPQHQRTQMDWHCLPQLHIHTFILKNTIRNEMQQNLGHVAIMGICRGLGCCRCSF